MSDGAQPARLLGWLMLASLAGCVSPAGIQHDQVLRDPAPLGAKAGQFAQWPSEDWWRAWNDPQLDHLMQLALQENPSLIQAAKRVDKATAYASAAESVLKPQVTGNVNVSRQRLSENAFYPPPYGGSWQTIADGSINAAWDLDFWGRNRSALQSALSQVEAAKAEQAAAKLLLTTAVARAYNQLSNGLAQQVLAQQALKQREQEFSLIRQRVENGLDTNLELRQGESQVAAAREQVETLDEKIGLARNALAALTAQDADTLKSLKPLLTQREIQAEPTAIPADLIGRRPDLAAARLRVDAAEADIASAKAEFYPNISLSAFVGLSSFGLSKFVELGSTLAGVGPAVHLPIFDAGRLRANLKGKNVDYDLAVASYNQTLIEAVHDVADQVTSVQSVRKQIESQRQALTAAESAYQLAMQRYEAGISNYLTVLTASDAVVRERARNADLNARLTDLSIALVKSLGGGYDHPPFNQASTSERHE
ncbi:RND transporter [Novimethylophilus kurashikiensis]|uniref:RND transporter n=1 Tax=Novimethylophilus kurashikiensis TaxID=1825523 RepID=A0A2R5F9A8_9PROT|nr:efflux transporter outer membrane subunit [Novimethylophilus kurashikiensis]GBG13503.1 RND transporter [Novimethylophilus kurashikiensis]